MQYRLRTLLIAAGIIPPLIFGGMWLFFYVWAMAYPLYRLALVRLGL